MSDEIDHGRRAILRLGVAGAGAVVSRRWLSGCTPESEGPDSAGALQADANAVGAAPDAGSPEAGAIGQVLGRDAAVRAYREWMPVRDTDNALKQWRRHEYGELVDLLMLDTRL
jgi:hypothetical protein